MEILIIHLTSTFSEKPVVNFRLNIADVVHLSKFAHYCDVFVLD